MNTLTEKELYDVEGGGLKIGLNLALGIGAAITFVIGVVNGILRPLTCTSSK